MKKNDTIAIIIARGGSKGIPRKNLVKLSGKPLISYAISKTLEAAKQWPMEVLVSTDDEEIKSVAESYGAWCPFLRPPELAEDHVTSFPVVKHALSIAETINKNKYEFVAYIQPTSPLWRVSDLVKCLNVLKIRSDFLSAVAVTEVGTHPFRMKRLIGGERLINFVDQGFEDMRPRQLLPKVYKRAGSIYVSRREVILNKETLVDNQCYGLVVPRNTAIDIDDYIDLLTVESIIKRKK